jgi:Tol biopolymer transport system component
MKTVFLIFILFLFAISCSENPTSPINDYNEYSLSEEAANFPWELFSGKMAFNRWRFGVVYVDCENRKMKLLKLLPYLDMITWHNSGYMITGVDLGRGGYGWGETRHSSFYCIDLEGKNASTLYRASKLHSWSNNGNLAYLGSPGSLGPWQSCNLYINNQFYLSWSEHKFSCTRPAWSPDSEYLVTSHQGKDSDSSFSMLKKFNVGTKVGTVLVIADSMGSKHCFEDPIYSPNGNKIAYVYINKNTSLAEIWTIDSDGSNKVRLTMGFQDSFPAWSPDNSKIIFQRCIDANDYDESEGIFLININGTGLQKVLSDGSMLPIWR